MYWCIKGKVNIWLALIAAYCNRTIHSIYLTDTKF